MCLGLAASQETDVSRVGCKSGNRCVLGWLQVRKQMCLGLAASQETYVSRVGCKSGNRCV